MKRGRTPFRDACRRKGVRPLSAPLLADIQSLDQVRIALRILAFEVVEQTPALPDQHQQAAARVMILCVRLEVLGEVVDAFAENGDLDFRGSGVALMCAVVPDQFSLAVFGKRHLWCPPRTLQNAAPAVLGARGTGCAVCRDNPL